MSYLTGINKLEMLDKLLEAVNLNVEKTLPTSDQTSSALMPDLSIGSNKGEETQHDDINPETIIGEQTNVSPQTEEQTTQEDKSQSEGEINTDEDESTETLI